MFLGCQHAITASDAMQFSRHDHTLVNRGKRNGELPFVHHLRDPFIRVLEIRIRFFTFLVIAETEAGGRYRRILADFSALYTSVTNSARAGEISFAAVGDCT